MGRPASTIAGGLYHPPHGKGHSPLGPDLCRHLVRGAADTSGPHLQHRRGVTDSLLEHLQRRSVRLLFHDVQGALDDALRDRLLAFPHYLVNESAQLDAAIPDVRWNYSLFSSSTTGHILISTLLRLGGTGLSLGAVLASSASPSVDACRVQRTTYHVVSNAGQVFNTSPAYQHDGVLLQVVAFAGNVGCHFHAVGKPYPGYFSKGGVRLFRCLRPHLNTNAPFLRGA